MINYKLFLFLKQNIVDTFMCLFTVYRDGGMTSIPCVHHLSLI